MPKLPKQLIDASMVGIQLVVSTVVGLAIGYGLDSAMDKWFDLQTRPWLTIIFLILGIIAGFRELYRMATRSSDENKSDKKDV